MAKDDLIREMGLSELLQKIPGQLGVSSQLFPHVKEPKNSYFFIGPEESGALDVAIAFAKAVMCDEGGCGVCSSCVSIDGGVHPDVYLYERIGQSLTVDDAREIRTKAYRSTSGSRYQVIILPEMELVGKAGPVLLKCVEEPPVSTIFLMQSDFEMPELRTLMSRSVVLHLNVPSELEIEDHLVSKGMDRGEANRVVKLCAGSLNRAVEISSDEELKSAIGLWSQVPELLEPQISKIIPLVDRLLETVNLVERRKAAEHKKELAELGKVAESLGIKKSSATDKAEARQKREIRRIRSAELRAGLTLLERRYRDLLVNGEPSPKRIEQILFAIQQIEDTQHQFRRNVNEFLILVSLFTRLADYSS